MVIYYTGVGIYNEVGVLKKFSLDYEISAEPNDNTFQVRTSIDNDMMERGAFIYVEEDLEIGGRVYWKRVDTKNKIIYYTGKTWRGMLASKVIQPLTPLGTPMNYYLVSGDLTNCVNQVLNHCSLDSMFETDGINTGVTLTDYKFYRYTDAYSGIMKMLSDNGYKMQIRFDSINKMCVIHLAPIVNYDNQQEITSDLFYLDITKASDEVYHLIALGRGE